MEKQWNSGVEQPDRPHLFGIRHLSPSGAWHLRKFLDETDPELVLIEGPSDFTELLEDLTKNEVKPPVAVMAYTSDLPIRTILYPWPSTRRSTRRRCGPGRRGKRPGFLICRPRYFWRLRIRRSCRKKIRERKTRKARKAGILEIRETSTPVLTRRREPGETRISGSTYWSTPRRRKAIRWERLSLERSFAAFLRTQRERRTEKTGFVNAACFGR